MKLSVNVCICRSAPISGNLECENSDFKKKKTKHRKDNTVQKRHERISSNISIRVYIARLDVSTKINIGTTLKENNYAIEQFIIILKIKKKQLST